MISRDTPVAIERVLVNGYRAMSPSEKLARVCALNHAVQQLALVRLRETYPRADERELRLRLAALWIDRDLMIKAFGWDPEREGY